MSLVKNELATFLTVTNLDPYSHLLGIGVKRTNEEILLSQSNYARKIVELTVIADCKNVKSPLSLSHPLYDELRPLTKPE